MGGGGWGDSVRTGVEVEAVWWPLSQARIHQPLRDVYIPAQEEVFSRSRAYETESGNVC